ncbi:MAG TPA: hypothetical protein VGD88_06020 [Opitutaceae bacterium]
MSSTPNLPTKTAIVFSGEEIRAVVRTDKGDRSILVRVRSMPARHLGTILALCTDEAALLDFVCQRQTLDENEHATGWEPVPAGWADDLHDESHVLLLEAAKRLNFTRAAAWGHRQIEAKQFQAPLLLKADEILMPVVQKMAALLVSSQKPSA